MSEMLRALFLVFLFYSPFQLFSQLNLQQIGHLPYTPLKLSGCKTHVDSSGNEWVLVGTSAGLSIVDLHDPAAPKERFFVPGLPNDWREVRTWNGFAYVVSEADSSGVTIVDLRELPDTVYWKVWRGDGFYTLKVRRAHTVQTHNGYLFLFGGGNVTEGATIADLSDPWNPHIVGKYTLNYVHDGYIRGNRLWVNEINKGQFAAVDITDITDPQLITTHPNPGGYSHNSELSDDGNILFTTAETSNAPLAAFDVSDLDNITLLDTYFPSQKPQKEVHNVRVLGNYLVNPSYGAQLTIVDATRPDNLIETAWAIVGNSFVWDADPYLPSGVIVATTKFDGLFVFQPTYQQAGWLEGTVTDAFTGVPLHDAKVFVTGTPNADTTKLNGVYKTGAALTGHYAVEVIKAGYQTKSFPDVYLESGIVTTLDIELTPEAVGVPASGEGTFRVYPTFFTDHLSVDPPSESPYRRNGTLVRLSDLSGKIVWEKAVDQWPLVMQNLQHLPAGPYLLTLENGAVRSAVRVAK